MTPDEYARAVRQALADIPEREELLEDLDDHLAEIAAESDVPLEERLGPPEVYAAELAAAYGGRSEGSKRASLLGRLRASDRYRGFVAFLPELRPGWWVLRGYVLAMLLLVLTFHSGLVPNNPGELIVVVAGILASVWFGRRRIVRPVAAAINVLAVLGLFGGFIQLEQWKSNDNVYAGGQDYAPVVVKQVSGGDQDYNINQVYNIKPYAKDGTPLSDIYLYDQDGKPITVSPEEYGFTVDKSCGEPVLNRYPLPLVSTPDEDAAAAAPQASACPSAGPKPSPVSSAVPTPVPTPVPRSTKGQ